MKKHHNGIWIFGTIILIIGAIQLIVAIHKHNGITFLMILGILGLCLGLALIVSGLVTSISATRYNKRYLQEHRDKIFIATCHHCHNEVECSAEDFEEHRNFPEGFVYCPICKKPLSANAFDEYDECDFY